MKYPLVLGFLLLFHLQSQAQSGPHSANGTILGYHISQDNSKLLTISYFEIVMWDLLEKKPIWVKRYSEYDLSEPLYIDNWKVEPNLTGYLYLQTNSDKILINLSTQKMKKTNQLFSNFTYNGKGVVTNYEGKNFLVDIETEKYQEIKELNGGAVSEDGKKLVSWYKNNIYKEYNFETNQVSKVDYSKQTQVRNDRFNATVAQEYSVSLKPIDKEIIIYDLSHKQIGRFPMKTKGNKEPSPRLIKGLSDKPYLYVFEEDNKTKTEGTLHQSYIVQYKIPSGEIVNVIELNNSGKEAQVELEKKLKEAEQQRKADELKRQELVTNAKAGYKEFDSKFTSLTLPLTINSNSAHGFELTGDGFITNDVRSTSGSTIYGIGKICSCKEYNSYLIMIKNQSSNSEQSHFLIITYKIDGSLHGSKTIGTSNKENKGAVRYDLTLSGTNCGVVLKGKTTHSNGTVQNKEYQLVGCTLGNSQ